MKWVEGRLRTGMGMFTVSMRVSAVNVRQMIGMVNTVTLAALNNG
jgi:hypothetical protein